MFSLAQRILAVYQTSISPVPAWAKLKKMIGPLATTVLTTRVERITIKTEQRAKQKWQECLFTSRIECFMKKRNIYKQPCRAKSFVSASSSEPGPWSVVLIWIWSWSPFPPGDDTVDAGFSSDDFSYFKSWLRFRTCVLVNSDSFSSSAFK